MASARRYRLGKSGSRHENRAEWLRQRWEWPIAVLRGARDKEAFDEIWCVVVIGCSNSGAHYRIFVFSPLLSGVASESGKGPTFLSGWWEVRAFRVVPRPTG
jgi:hypothetical protein